MTPPPTHTHTHPPPPRVVHRSRTINRTLLTTRESILKLYAHNITDAVDNKIVTHFMQLNAEWSFYGSLVIFRQELVILTDFKYPCSYIDPHFQRKMFQECNFNINIRGIAEIIVPVRGYTRHSPNQVMIKRKWLTDEILLSFS